LGQLLQTLSAHNGSGGVVGVGKDNHFGVWRQAFFELLDLQLVSVLLPQGDRHRYTAEDSGVQEVVWIAGVGHHDLIAWVNKGHHCKHQAGI